MISWIVIVILVIAGIFAIKMNHFRHRIFIILLLIFALFLYSTMTLVDNKNDFNYGSTEGVIHALGVYTGWLANGFQNLRAITGNAFKMDWSSTNGSFFNKSDDFQKTDVKTKSSYRR